MRFELGDIELGERTADCQNALHFLFSSQIPGLSGVYVFLVQLHDLIVIDHARVGEVEGASEALLAHRDNQRPKIVHHGDRGWDRYNLLKVDQFGNQALGSRQGSGGIIRSQVEAIGVAFEQVLDDQTCVDIEGFLVVGLIRFLRTF